MQKYYDENVKNAQASAVPSAGAAKVLAKVVPPTKSTLLDDFTKKPNGGFFTADTGQEWIRTGAEPLEIRDGGMTLATIGTGYTTTDLGKAPAKFGASVVFDKGEGQAVAALLISKGPELDLGNMGVHYFFDINGWQMQVRENGQTPFPSLGKGSFVKPLTADSKTVHNVEISISGDAITVHQPDGTVNKFTDPRVSKNVSGNVAWEVWSRDAGQARPIYKKVWADLP